MSKRRSYSEETTLINDQIFLREAVQNHVRISSKRHRKYEKTLQLRSLGKFLRYVLSMTAKT